MQLTRLAEVLVDVEIVYSVCSILLSLQLYGVQVYGNEIL